MNRKKYLTVAIVLAVGSGNVNAAQIVYDTPVSWDSVNFTTLNPDGSTMGGGGNNVEFAWDGTLFTDSSDYAGVGGMSNVIMSTTTLFQGALWTAHDIQMFSPGTYAFDTTIGGGGPESGLLNMSVGTNQLGMRMLFDWNGGLNIDIALVFDKSSVFGSGMAASANPVACGSFGGGAGSNCLWDGGDLGPAGAPSGSTNWALASADGDLDAVPGIGMAPGGPFAGFQFNFNIGAAGTSNQRYWGGGSGIWGASNWSETLVGITNMNVPADGDRVFVRGTGPGAETVTHGVSTAGTLDALEVGNTGGGTTTFSQIAGSSLTTEETTVATGGVYAQSGGAHASANLTVDAGGAYNLTGGSLNVTGNITNDGTLSQTGGSITASAINNNGNFNISGAGSKVITADINNNVGGTVKVTAPAIPCTPTPCFNSDVTYTGTVTNSGTWISDPIDQRFSDLIITPTGLMIGVAGDRFTIGGDLVNNSTQNTLWDTDQVALRFEGVGLHDFALAGDDFGNAVLGFGNNFAFGELSLESGVTLNLLDGNVGNAGTALYIDLLTLGGGLAQLGDISSIYDIYYRSDLAGNAYLGGQDFLLAGGGSLRAVSAVPVPAAVWLFGSGLLGLIGVARKKRA